MPTKHVFFMFFYLFFFIVFFFPENFEIKMTFFKFELNYKKELINYNDANTEYFKYTAQLNEYLKLAENYELKKEENILRRAEILFFGSLTIVSFASWMTFSIYNTMMYGDNFGNLRRDQFLIMYLGSGIIAFSVSISDLFIRLKPKIKGVEIY